MFLYTAFKYRRSLLFSQPAPLKPSSMKQATVGVVLLAAVVTAYTDIRHKRFMIKNIDPLVFPGEYRSHMHSFFGSDAVTKDLPTTEVLQKGCPSGENPNDLSVYCKLDTLPARIRVAEIGTDVRAPRKGCQPCTM